MAVLFCIKAVESVPAENVYSTEEIRIGTWIDKPLYRRVIPITSPNSVNTEVVGNNESFDCIKKLVNIYGTFGDSTPINSNWGRNAPHYFFVRLQEVDGVKKLCVTISHSAYANITTNITIEYTKNTD